MQENEQIKNEAFLSLKNVEKTYPNGEKAVHDFNLEIERNEFIVIVGPSGCGKSTTLRMIAGLEDISRGEIYMENELINYKPSKDRKMAIVFQSYALYPQMNVYDNIAFPLTINKYPFPIVNEPLESAEIIRRLLAENFEKTAVSAAGAAQANTNKAKAEAAVAAGLNVTIGCAGRLIEYFKPYRQLNNEELFSRRGEITEKILSKLEKVVSAEKAVLEQNKTVLNEKFHVIDENGDDVIEYRKMTPYEVKTKVYDTAAILDLAPYLDKLPKELSGGQMQRVALGRAIVKNVPVFLMDEPLSNLDAKLRLTMRSEIVKLHNKINATTIYVTHDQTEAMTMATKIVVMSKGFIQQIGSPEVIYKDPVNIFVAKFIGSPAMNIFDLNLDRENKMLMSGQLKIKIDDEFINKYDAFLNEKIDEFRNLCDILHTEDIIADDKGMTDEQKQSVIAQMKELAAKKQAASEALLKILSGTGSFKNEKVKQPKKSISTVFKKLFGKKQEAPKPYAYEIDTAEEKLASLNAALAGTPGLLVGIRPERIKIERYDENRTYDNGIVLNPTVCELLGAEYNVHFDYCGKSMVGKIDADEKITTKDKIVVYFMSKDIYVFDPITGERIR